MIVKFYNKKKLITSVKSEFWFMGWPEYLLTTILIFIGFQALRDEFARRTPGLPILLILTAIWFRVKWLLYAKGEIDIDVSSRQP